ncbi:nucleolar protein 11 [Choristoneura fumiferana]|uniref:nucleolar protein 11 n=1 Tax=Choristoneura fumiferana TaxID=7141 RepID=UPI003D15ACD7
MAKLHSYYVLCPLIDQKSFLGVAHDKEEETVIVTLGRNVVNKYRLSDQKQTGGWTSKDHITAPVIYDKSNSCYVGVFNNNTIKMWKEDSDNLDKVKKYKFQIPILKVLSNHIVFANGNCAALTYAIENRKSYDSKASIKDTEEIVAAESNKSEICFIIKSESSYDIVHCPLRVELGDLDKSKMNRVKVTRPEDVYVVGHLIHMAEKDVYILWSDSKMVVYNLPRKTWNTVGTIPWISTTDSVSLMWMNYGHIVAFGSNLERDGAIIVAYNINLGIGSCRYPMKMYSKDAKLFCFDNRIVLEASNHVGILPYVVELKRNLSSLLGSHEIAKDDHMEIADWGSMTTPQFQVTEDVEQLIKQGLSERTICFQVISDILENKSSTDSESILSTLKQFKDVPETVILLLINHVFKTVDTDFDITDNAEIANAVSSFASEFKLLEYLFGLTFSDALLIPHLQSGMPLNDALFLMAYISYLLIGTEKDLDVEENRLLDWCALLMDAFYQQYLMTKDDKVTIVLQKMLEVLVNLINQLGIVDNTIALMHKVLYTKPSDDNEEVLPYTIELMEI